MCSIQIDARKEQLSLAKTELKQAKKEAKSKGSSDTKMQTYVLQERAGEITAIKKWLTTILNPPHPLHCSNDTFSAGVFE